MNPTDHGESSDNHSGVPLRRKRGRPRKDPTLNYTVMANQPPHFEQATRQTVGQDTMVGQAVNGVIEASFDSGYVLSVRIGNSNLRGVVFKPEHIVPITTENDIAPHLQMIQREPIVSAGGNQRSSTRGQKLAVQRAGTKPRYNSQENGGSEPIQHINFQVGQQTIMDDVDNDLDMVEPFHSDQTIPVSELFVVSDVQNDGEGGGQGSEQGYGVSLSGGNMFEDGQGEKFKVMASTTDVVNPGYSSQASDIKSENEKEVTEPSGEGINLPLWKDSGIIMKQEIENVSTQFSTESLPGVADTTAPTLLNFRTGGMTELLQAVQGNAKETPVYAAEPPPVMNHETVASETDQHNNASAP